MGAKYLTRQVVSLFKQPLGVAILRIGHKGPRLLACRCVRLTGAYEALIVKRPIEAAVGADRRGEKTEKRRLRR